MATTTDREQIAVAAIQDILRREDYQPELLKDMAKALAKARNVLPPPDAVIVRNRAYSLKTIEERLARFIHYLPPDNRPEITDTSFYDENFLNQLISTIDEVSGLAPSAEAKVSMDAVVPTKAKLQELQDILKAQAETTASIKDRLGRPSQLQQQIEQAQKIGIRAQLLRVNVSKSLITTLTESSYVRDLQTIYGREAVNQLLAQRIDLAVNQSVTALALNQLGVSDPSQTAAYFAAQLEKNLKADRGLLAVALAKTHKVDRKNVLADAKNLAEEAAKEVDPAAKAFRAEQDSSPLIKVNAQNIAQGEIEAALVKSGRSLTKKQTARLAEALAKYSNQPEKQLRILKRILPAATPETRQQLIENLNPVISALAKSSDRPVISETIDENSLVNLARINPGLFPFRLTAAIRANKLSTGETAALTIRLSQQLGVSPDYVALKLVGITAKNLTVHLNNLAKGQPVFGLPTQPPLRPDNLIFQRLNRALPGIEQLDNNQEEFLFNPIASSLNLQSNWRSITHFFDVGKAIRFNVGRLPPVGRITSSIQTAFSGLRVQSGAVNSVFNFFSSASGGFGKLRSAAAYPFRAVGSAVSAGWNNVKTWAGTQVKAGLAKAGAWLAKKGVTAAATKLGLVAVGKGAAALMAQAVPVAGQIAGVLTVLSIFGDIGKFIWDHKKEIGLGLGGMFFLGQMLLAKVLGFLGSAAWTLGGALAGGVLGMAFGPVGAFVGGIAGGLSGYLISSGALGAALSGLGSALGSAAAGLSSFIGSLTAPSLVAGVGTTISTVVIGGIIGAGILDTFFIKPRTNSAMFVPTERSSSAPRDGGGGGFIPPDIVGAGTCPLVENPSISTGTLGSGLGRSEHGGRGYGGPYCYGIPIRPMWVWEDDYRPDDDPIRQMCKDRITGTPMKPGNCNDSRCPYYGFATDVESTSTSNPTVRLPIICSDTATDISQCQPMAWTVVDHFYNCRGGWTTTKEECGAKNFAGVTDKHDQLWGWGTIFESHDNDHYWRLYLNHYENTVSIGIGSIFHSSLEQADTIGYIPVDNYVKHLHYELVMDDSPIRPDFLCDSSAGQLYSPIAAPPPTPSRVR